MNHRPNRHTGAFVSFLTGAFLLAALPFLPFHTEQEDGPYLFRRDNKVYVSYIVNDHGVKGVRTDSMDASHVAQLTLQVKTDLPGRFFTVKLQPELQTAKNEYDGHKKILALSDIEGNFGSFRKLLQANGVIDDQFNWTFGDGHLVLTGDFFDRGQQVTEVLWLIYSLEEKAKAAGGQVHFVLGNHEIMNMSYDFRYVHGKYMEAAQLMGLQYGDLYGPSTELGAWLRTKNIAEKIGPYLFVHGGISPEVLQAEIGLSKMNKLARPFYDDTTFQYKDPRTALLYSDLGPFWYRGYYTGNSRTSEQQLDAILDYYDVKQVVTGHTIISDTISVLMNGKLINTDVQHYKGHSEALLIEGGNRFRVNAVGEKMALPRRP